jgi:hypothetical protein
MIQALLISALGFAFATSTGPRRAHKLTDEVPATPGGCASRTGAARRLG